MSASYLYSIIVSIVQSVMVIALLVALFLLVLQLIKYFKSRNLALAHENACAEAPQQKNDVHTDDSDHPDDKADENPGE